jgi:CRISPR-associated endonuclease/helicase Cas3
MSASEIVRHLGGKASVYVPYVLLRTLEVWKGRSRITLPTQIRGLIEATYEPRDEEPEAWQELFLQSYGKGLAYRQKALRSANIWTVSLEDDEGVQTRLNEDPTCSLVLCRHLSKTDAELIDGSRADFHGEEFRLATAQAVHRNVVKVPLRIMKTTAEHPGIARYVRGPHGVGLVDPSGEIVVDGLGDCIRLMWSNEHGVVIDNAVAKGEL